MLFYIIIYLIHVLNALPASFVSYLFLSFITYVGFNLFNNTISHKDYKKYNVEGGLVRYTDPYSQWFWVHLPERRSGQNSLEQFTQPYVLMFPPSSKPQKFPPIEQVLDLLIANGPRQVQSNGQNLFLLWFANLIISTFLHSDNVKADLVQSNSNGFPLPRTNYLYFTGRPFYGATLEDERLIREFSGGRVKMINNFPLTTCDINAPRIVNPRKQCAFVSGKDTANNSVGNFVFQTIFMRAHNAQCRDILRASPFLTDEQVFQIAKTRVLYLFLKMTLAEYILGLNLNTISIRYDYMPIEQYTKQPMCVSWEYNVAYQWHAMLPDHVGTQTLEEMVYNPESFYKKNIGEWLQIARDTHIYSNRAGNTPQFLSDAEKYTTIACRRANMQTYCDYRRLLKMSVPKTFLEVCGGDQKLAQKISTMYETVEDIEFYVGIRCEKENSDNILGDTTMKILSLIAFESISRASDRFKDFLVLNDPNGASFLNQKIPSVKDFVISHLTQFEKNFVGDELTFFVSKK